MDWTPETALSRLKKDVEEAAERYVARLLAIGPATAAKAHKESQSLMRARERQEKADAAAAKDAEIAALAENGTPRAEIARQFSISTSRVAQRISRHKARQEQIRRELDRQLIAEARIPSEKRGEAIWQKFQELASAEAKRQGVSPNHLVRQGYTIEHAFRVNGIEFDRRDLNAFHEKVRRENLGLED